MTDDERQAAELLCDWISRRHRPAKTWAFLRKMPRWQLTEDTLYRLALIEARLVIRCLLAETKGE